MAELMVNSTSTSYDNISNERWMNIQFSDGKTISFPQERMAERWPLIELQMKILKINPFSRMSSALNPGSREVDVIYECQDGVALKLPLDVALKKALTISDFSGSLTEIGRVPSEDYHREAFRQAFINKLG
jgi:hypothetical protein